MTQETYAVGTGVTAMTGRYNGETGRIVGYTSGGYKVKLWNGTVTRQLHSNLQPLPEYPISTRVKVNLGTSECCPELVGRIGMVTGKHSDVEFYDGYNVQFSDQFPDTETWLHCTWLDVIEPTYSVGETVAVWEVCSDYSDELGTLEIEFTGKVISVDFCECADCEQFVYQVEPLELVVRETADSVGAYERTANGRFMRCPASLRIDNVCKTVDVDVLDRAYQALARKAAEMGRSVL